MNENQIVWKNKSIDFFPQCHEFNLDQRLWLLCQSSVHDFRYECKFMVRQTMCSNPSFYQTHTLIAPLMNTFELYYHTKQCLAIASCTVYSMHGLAFNRNLKSYFFAVSLIFIVIFLSIDTTNAHVHLLIHDENKTRGKHFTVIL